MLWVALSYCVKLLNTTVVHKFFLCKESMHFTVTYLMIGHETVYSQLPSFLLSAFTFPTVITQCIYFLQVGFVFMML